MANVDKGGLEATTRSIRDNGGEASFRRGDVSREPKVAAPTAFAVKTYGGLDTVFSNAGIEQPVTPSHEVSESLFDHVIGVNLKGTFFGCKHALPYLLEWGGGTVVNNCSVSALANVGGNVSYAASEGAVMSLTRVLALESVLVYDWCRFAN